MVSPENAVTSKEGSASKTRDGSSVEAAVGWMSVEVPEVVLSSTL